MPPSWVRPWYAYSAAASPRPRRTGTALFAEMISSYREVADYAAGKGVFIGLHNHPPVDSPTGEEIIEILRETGRRELYLHPGHRQVAGLPGHTPDGRGRP